MSINTLILASHGTVGAQAAEDMAIQLAVIGTLSISHLYVVPEFWRGMRGDDWLNNNVTQERFGDYIEDSLAAEAKIEVERLKEKAIKAGVVLESQAMFGKPVDCLISLYEQLMEKQQEVASIIIGTPRLKGEQGYNSRMDLDPLVRSLRTQLIVVPRQL